MSGTDYGMIYLYIASGDVVIPPSGSILSTTNATTPAAMPYSVALVNTPVGTKISLDTLTGIITIADTGIYHITIGGCTTDLPMSTFLQINGQPIPSPNTFNIYNTSLRVGQEGSSVSIIVPLTTLGGSTLRLVNYNVGSRKVGNNNSSRSQVQMTITKLQ